MIESESRQMMKSRRPTRTDVAAKAGVAPSTVTLILTDKGPELRIPERTQERVREAARALGYYPNKHIQSVLRGRSGILGLYLRWDQWYRPLGYWTTVFWQIQRAAAKLDIQLLVHNARLDTPTEESFARHAGGLVDGVMIVNSGDDPIVGRIVEAKLPAVEIGDPFSELPFVGLDTRAGVRLAMEHLAAKGYRRPAFMGYTTNYVENSLAREVEFLSSAEELFGIGAKDRIVVSNNGWNAFPDLMALSPKADCVICLGDEMAYDVLCSCDRAGIWVPDDLAIVGYDALTTLGTNRLTTSVQTPLEEMATLAIRKLLDVVEGNPFEHDTILPVGLRVGDTT